MCLMFINEVSAICLFQYKRIHTHVLFIRSIITYASMIDISLKHQIYTFLP